MLVLKARTARSGEVKAFDVVRAEEGVHAAVLGGLPEGDYKVMDGTSVEDVAVSYRTVLDLHYGDGTIVRDHTVA